MIHRDTILSILLLASLVDVGPYNNNQLAHISCFSFSHFSLALHLNHSRGKIAAVDEEASGREWRDFAHCAAIIPVTRDTSRGLPDEILEEALSPVGEATGPILFTRDPWGGPSIRCARKDAAR